MRNIKTFRNNNNNNTRSNLFQNRENSLNKQIFFLDYINLMDDSSMSHELIILARKMEEMEVEMTRQQSDRFDSSIFIAIHYSIRQLEQDRTRNGQQGR